MTLFQVVWASLFVIFASSDNARCSQKIDGQSCPIEIPLDVAALLQGSVGVQRMTAVSMGEAAGQLEEEEEANLLEQDEEAQHDEDEVETETEDEEEQEEKVEEEFQQEPKEEDVKFAQVADESEDEEQDAEDEDGLMEKNQVPSDSTKTATVETDGPSATLLVNAGLTLTKSGHEDSTLKQVAEESVVQKKVAKGVVDVKLNSELQVSALGAKSDKQTSRSPKKVAATAVSATVAGAGQPEASKIEGQKVAAGIDSLSAKDVARQKAAAPVKAAVAADHKLKHGKGYSEQRMMMVVIAAASAFVSILALVKFGALSHLITLFLFVVYILWSSTLLLVNKGLVHQHAYVHPVILVTMHMMTCSVVFRGLHFLMPQWFEGYEQMREKTWGENRGAWRSFAMIAVFFSISLVCENSAYFYSSVGLLQMVKETGVLFVASCAVAMGLDVLSPRRIVFLFLVTAGGIMCVHGELQLAVVGPLLQIGSNFCNGMRLTLQNKMLVQSGLKLDPLSYVTLVSPLCLLALLVPASVVFMTHPNILIAIRLSLGTVIASCLLAVGLNLLVAILVQRVSAIGFCLVGAVKNVFVILFVVVAMGQETTFTQMIGCSLIFSASTLYVIVTHHEKNSVVKSAGQKEILKEEVVLSTEQPSFASAAPMAEPRDAGA